MKDRIAVHTIITVIGVIIFLPFLSNFSLFDWDEINFAESAREMIVSGNYRQVQIAFEPFWEKPPLFIWMQVLCMKIFGISEFAARLPNAICGIVTLHILYAFGRNVRNHFTGIFWVLAYGASLAPSLYFRSGIIDPVFNLFIFLSVWNLFQAETDSTEKSSPRWRMFLVGIFAGLAVLTKGPVALLILFVVWLVRLLLNPRYAWAGWMNSLLAVLTCALVTCIWVVPEFIQEGTWFFKEFWRYQITLAKGQMEWHNQPWFYHIVVLLFLCFPASIFALPQLFRNQDFAGSEKLWSAYMRILFWTVLVIFSLISTKIVHYSSLCWFPLGWFAGNSLYKSHTLRGRNPKWILIPYVLVVLVLGLATTLLPLVFTQPEARSLALELVRDKMGIAILNNRMHWQGWEWIPGVFLLIGSLAWLARRKSWHGHWPFTITAIFSLTLSAIVLPKTEQTLQRDFVQELKTFQGKDVYIESWGYKTYAIYYYAAVEPKNFQGKWNQEKSRYAQFQNPNTQARLDWLMNRAVDKPVYIFTKADFDPDWYFNNKFQKVKPVGAYILWARKDITKSDIRM